MGELLTLKEVGRRLKIEADTVRRFWILTGDLPAQKVGRQWRVDEDEIPGAIERRALREREEIQRKALQEQDELERKKLPDPFADLNTIIAPGGECTVPSQQDQLQRETSGREFTPPDIPE